MVSLTKKGARLTAEFLPRHEKWVTSTMRALRSQEQATLSRLCRKLGERYMEKFFYAMRSSGR
jgi:DNA-binding MarR family transcriptional regulator